MKDIKVKGELSINERRELADRIYIATKSKDLVNKEVDKWFTDKTFTRKLKRW